MQFLCAGQVADSAGWGSAGVGIVGYGADVGGDWAAAWCADGIPAACLKRAWNARRANAWLRKRQYAAVAG